MEEAAKSYVDKIFAELKTHDYLLKNERFKQESFLDEVKVFYTDLINQMALDDKDRLSIFDKNGPYLAATG